MIRSTMNQRGNCKNPNQGEAIKALCVCSAGLLRSPSIAKYLTGLGYNTRACGTSQEYALIPVSEALLTWADEIHVVQGEEAQIDFYVNQIFPPNHHERPSIHSYDIPDMYGTFDPELMKIIEEQYNAENTGA
jgi:predicted protein tyrosine phosphatase